MVSPQEIDGPSQIKCEGPKCSIFFAKKKGRKYCSDICRAKASDVRRIERVKKALLDGTLDENDIKAISKLLGKKLAAKKERKPLRLNKSHRDLLAYIDEKNTFFPAIDKDETPLSWGRRARELRAEGILESFRVGRIVGFRRPPDIRLASSKRARGDLAS